MRFSIQYEHKKKIRNFAVTPVAVTIPYSPFIACSKSVNNKSTFQSMNKQQSIDSIRIQLTSPLLYSATSNRKCPFWGCAGSWNAQQ